MIRRIFLPTLCFLAVALCSSVARADTITVAGAQSGQVSTATVVCEFNAQTNTFTFTITNTSAITSPGSTATITAIGYDLPPAGNASASGLNGFTGMQAPSSSSTFTFSDAAVGSIPQFSSAVADFAFLTGNSGTFDTGSSDDGLLPGESASFTVSGAAFAGFTEAQICNSILVRFEGIGASGNDSDVAAPPAGNGDPDPTPTPTPTPGDQIVGSETGSQATATVNCTFNAQTNTFTFTIENTSPYDAQITAIGFDVGPGNLNGFTGSQAPSLGSNFRFSDGAVGKVPGFKGANLDFAFLTGKNFGGGSPDFGIGPGESASFTVSGAAFAGYTEEQICNAIYVRFQDVGEFAEDSDVGVPAQEGRIVIIKQAAPESAQVFGFTTTGAGLSNFTLVDDGNDNDATPNSITFDVAPGPYSITETANGLYDLTNVTCSVQGGGSSNFSPNIVTQSVSINLQAGDTVTCTFFDSVTTQ